MTVADTELRKANRLFQEQKYGEAREELHRLERSGFESPEMRLLLGFCERRSRRSFDALRHFEIAAKAIPSDYRPPFQIACAWDELGDHAQAEKWYRRSLSLEPGNPRAHSNLGNALQDMGRKKEAVESYRRALDLSPSLAVTHYNLATALFDHDDPGPAVEALEKALTLDPGLDRANFDLGILYWLQGENLRAEKCMEKVRAAGLDYLINSLEYVKASDIRNAVLRRCLRRIPVRVGSGPWWWRGGRVWRQLWEFNPLYRFPDRSQSVWLRFFRGTPRSLVIGAEGYVHDPRKIARSSW
jgi:tetratricopeptide (TPR) repeat protein